ncbi:MAG: hypothetical protein HIU83_07615 [Proteobacteria bacterium]|nr:hypothetical protein [Pseudomonadota bacterium]
MPRKREHHQTYSGVTTAAGSTVTMRDESAVRTQEIFSIRAISGNFGSKWQRQLP